MSATVERLASPAPGNSSSPPDSRKKPDHTGHPCKRPTVWSNKPDKSDRPTEPTIEPRTSLPNECRACVHSLEDVVPENHEERRAVDIVVETIRRIVTFGVKTCSLYYTEARGTYPDDMPGPS